MLLLKPRLSRKPSKFASLSSLLYLHHCDVGRGQAWLCCFGLPATPPRPCKGNSEEDEAWLLGRLQWSSLLLRAHLLQGQTLTPVRVSTSKGCVLRRSREELQQRSCAPQFPKSPTPQGCSKKIPRAPGSHLGNPLCPCTHQPHTALPGTAPAPSLGPEKPPPKLTNLELSVQGKGTLCSPTAGRNALNSRCRETGKPGALLAAPHWGRNPPRPLARIHSHSWTGFAGDPPGVERRTRHSCMSAQLRLGSNRLFFFAGTATAAAGGETDLWFW